VSAPCHCALRAPAQERLRADLDATEFRDLVCPLVNNWQAREIHTGAEAREGVYQQVPNPVRWLDSVRYLAAQGACLDRAGRVHVERDAAGQVWVGGESVTCIAGSVAL
jgi:malonyl CoA-acyl carrier protein transacylase